jgi:hypothetical protein
VSERTGKVVYVLGGMSLLITIEGCLTNTFVGANRRQMCIVRTRVLGVSSDFLAGMWWLKTDQRNRTLGALNSRLKGDKMHADNGKLWVLAIVA